MLPGIIAQASDGGLGRRAAGDRDARLLSGSGENCADAAEPVCLAEAQ